MRFALTCDIIILTELLLSPHSLSLSLSLFLLPLPPLHTGGKTKSVSRIMLDIIQKEGPRHLFKGLLPRLIAVPSMMSVFYVINEELEKLLLGKEFSK